MNTINRIIETVLSFFNRKDKDEAEKSEYLQSYSRRANLKNGDKES